MGRAVPLLGGPPPFRSMDASSAEPDRSDCRNAQPAGKLFRHNGSLYRPAQDMSHGYGSGSG